MTTSNVESRAHSAHSIGTLTAVSWTMGPTDDLPAIPRLMVYSLGDGLHGPEAGAQELRAVLEGMGATIGAEVAFAGEERELGVHLLVEAERAVLNLPFMQAQCPVTPEWQEAAYERGNAILTIPLLPWPEAAPGTPITEERLKAFVTDDKVVRSSAHITVPVSRIQG
ncbi:DUF5949 family protein [Streptomyces sp. NPDC101160]|uniref:DUF5949 family protein n=1 Tax=Streptomyces sp. NPDC101160 TaxID=3366118 RepID=UPI0038108586